MSVTIREVAKRANVSLGTVSRYLNGYKLREHNRLRIEEAIRELGFQENIIAKGLKNNRSMTIGVVLASLTDLFATSVITAAESILAKENYSIIVCDFQSSQLQLEQKLRFLKSRSVDGLILFPGKYSCPEILQEYADDGIPVVIVNDDMPSFQTDKVTVDNSNASFRAVEWLIHQNHRDIAIINGDLGTYTGRERYKGYLEAMQTYDIKPRDEYITYGHFSNRGGYEAAINLLSLEKPPTAIYITNYYMTFGAIIAINERKIKIPGDISIIGFDHFELSDVINPPLTVVEQPTQRIGEMAAQTVIRRIKGDYDDFPVSISVKTRMIIRDSVKKI
jgi:LacI family transcriptional regulator